MLPKVVEDLVLDYYWSHKTYKRKQKMHQELKKIIMIHEMHVFHRIFSSFNVHLSLMAHLQHNV